MMKVDITQFSVLPTCNYGDNNTGAISGPLRDRMDVIRIAGYDIPEKIAIARNYLVPKALEHAGLDLIKDLKVDITDAALDMLVRQYCRESGVRNLERHVDMLTRKIAFKVVSESEKSANEVEQNTGGENVDRTKPLKAEGNSAATTTDGKTLVDATVVAEIHRAVDPVKVDETNLAEYIGQPRYTEVSEVYAYVLQRSSGMLIVVHVQKAIYDSSDMPIGVVMGLGWNPLGNSTYVMFSMVFNRSVLI